MDRSQIPGLWWHRPGIRQPLLPLVSTLELVQKFPIDFNILQRNCPLQTKNGLALAKMKFLVYDVMSAHSPVSVHLPEGTLLSQTGLNQLWLVVFAVQDITFSQVFKDTKRKEGWRGLSLLCDVCGQRKGVIPNRVQFHGSAEFCDLGPNKIWSGNWHKCWKSQVVKCNRKVYYYMLLGCLKCRILWHHDLGSDILYM